MEDYDNDIDMKSLMKAMTNFMEPKNITFKFQLDVNPIYLTPFNGGWYNYDHFRKVLDIVYYDGSEASFDLSKLSTSIDYVNVVGDNLS